MDAPFLIKLKTQSADFVKQCEDGIRRRAEAGYHTAVIHSIWENEKENAELSSFLRQNGFHGVRVWHGIRLVRWCTTPVAVTERIAVTIYEDGIYEATTAVRTEEAEFQVIWKWVLDFTTVADIDAQLRQRFVNQHVNGDLPAFAQIIESTPFHEGKKECVFDVTYEQ